MSYTPVKTVTYSADASGLAQCSGCPGYAILPDQEVAHTTWHASVGTDPIVIVPPPVAVNQVTNLKAVATGAGQITVSWTLPTKTPTALTVGRNGVEAGGGSANWSGSIAGTATSNVFNNLAASTPYVFTVTPAGGVPATVTGVTQASTTGTTPPVVTPPVVTPPVTTPTSNGFGAAAPQGSSGKWALDFSDDFTAALDSSKWLWSQRADGGVTGWGSDEWYDASAVSVADSCLVMTMTHQSGNGRSLKSGTVSTGPSSSGARYSFKPGMFMEIRSMVPPASDGDLWPAWWGISIKGWPPEQDWYEFGYGAGTMGDTGGKPVTTWHYTGSNGSPTQTCGGSYGTGDLRGAWHVYGVHWSSDATTLTMFVDGKQYQTYSMTMAPNNQWQTPQVIIFSHQSQNASVKDGSQYKIDWINVWKPA